MANEFRIKNGLIITGSSYLSESVFAPNLPTEPSPQYFMTWRQSDGRFEVTPSSAISTSTLTQGCWDAIAYASTPSTGEFSIRSGGGSLRLDSNTSTLWLHKTDNTGVDQTTSFNTIGVNSVLTFYINSQTIKYSIVGVTKLTGSDVYSFSLSHLSGDSGVFSIGDELCYDITISSSGGSPSSNTCLSLNMTDSVTNVDTTQGDAVFYRVNPLNGKGWYTRLGTVDNNITTIHINNTDLTNKNVATFFSNFTGNLSLSYSDPINQTSHNTTFNYSGYGASGNIVQIYVTYASGNSGYTILNNQTFTLCKI